MSATESQSNSAIQSSLTIADTLSEDS